MFRQKRDLIVTRENLLCRMFLERMVERLIVIRCIFRMKWTLSPKQPSYRGCGAARLTPHLDETPGDGGLVCNEY
jgi:hypothetical protein